MLAKEKVIQLIREFIQLDPSQEDLIKTQLHPKSIKKGEFLLKIGAKNRVVAYLDTGLMRSLYYDAEGNEITAGFFQEHMICTDLNSFETGQRSQRSIEALLDCNILILDFEAQQRLRQGIKQWAYFEQNYIATLLLKKVNFQRNLSNNNAQKAFQLFTETYNQAARYAPRYQIASFLGISPYTLSRLNNR